MAHAPHAFRKEWKERRLGVVMFLDMVGYSAHMSKSEGHAMARVKHLSELLHELVPEYGGTLVKFLGDGTMAEFPTAVAAVACSLTILDAIHVRNHDVKPTDRYDVRIGLHLGDLVEKDKDLFGDTVNVAARIQPLADPGGLAMTSTVYFSVRNQISLHGAFLGSPQLKNISERIRLYAVPPPHIPFIAWYLKRRNPINTRLRAILLALAIAGIGVGSWFAGRAGAPRAALLYVRPSVVADPLKAPLALDYARQVAEEINNRGGEVPGWQWKDRAAVLDLLTREGVTDPENADQADRAAAGVARRGALAYLVGARLNDTGMGSVRMSVKLVDARTMAVLANFDLKADRPTRLAEALIADLQAWSAKTLTAAPPPPEPKKKKKRRR